MSLLLFDMANLHGVFVNGEENRLPKAILEAYIIRYKLSLLEIRAPLGHRSGATQMSG
jgi:hypothetical protein